MIRLIAFVLCLLVSPALAQQQLTPAQTALQIDNVINQWAQTIENQAQALKAAQERIDALKAKCGKPCAEPEKK